MMTYRDLEYFLSNLDSYLLCVWDAWEWMQKHFRSSDSHTLPTCGGMKDWSLNIPVECMWYDYIPSKMEWDLGISFHSLNKQTWYTERNSWSICALLFFPLSKQLSHSLFYVDGNLHNLKFYLESFGKRTKHRCLSKRKSSLIGWVGAKR